MKNLSLSNKVVSFFAIVFSVFFVVTAAQAATTISTDISTAGSLTVGGASTLFGTLTVPTIAATSTTATSTVAGGFAVHTSGLVYDFQTGNVGINTASPAAKLDVTTSGRGLMNLESTAADNQLQMTSYRNSAFTHNLLYGLAARGTKASPLAVNAGDALISIRGSGYGTTQFENTSDDSAAIDLAADENYTDSAAGGKIVFYTRVNGNTGGFLNAVMVINNLGQVTIGQGKFPTPSADLTVSTTTNNATTTIQFGKSGQNKGTCLALYDVTGAAVYVRVQGGALVVSVASCR